MDAPARARAVISISSSRQRPDPAKTREEEETENELAIPFKCKLRPKIQLSCQVRHFFVDNSAKTEYLLYQRIFSGLLWVPILLSQKFIYVALLHIEARV